MTLSPEVSVVMSVYNGAPHLRESIESMLMQEDVDFEFIIVNDGSTDETPQILKEYSDKDGRITVLHQKNQGLTKALIRGCSEAKGKYIARQDVGDTSLPGRLLIQKKTLDANENLSFVSCWSEFCGPQTELLFIQKGTGKASKPTQIIDNRTDKGVVDGPACHPSVMFYRAAYLKAGGYRPDFYYAQDWDLWYRLAEVGMFQMVEQPLYRVILRPGSISSNKRKEQLVLGSLALEALRRRRMNVSDRSVLDKAAQIRPQGETNDSRINNAAWLYFIGECLRRKGDKRAFDYLKKSLVLNPFSPKTWVRIVQTFFCAG
jgi:glycosyltransferase involved in cell wall biosynthesis